MGTASDKQKRATPFSFAGNLPKLANHANAREWFFFFALIRVICEHACFHLLFVSIRVHSWLRFPNAQRVAPVL